MWICFPFSTPQQLKQKQFARHHEQILQRKWLKSGQTYSTQQCSKRCTTSFHLQLIFWEKPKQSETMKPKQPTPSIKPNRIHAQVIGNGALQWQLRLSSFLLQQCRPAAPRRPKYDMKNNCSRGKDLWQHPQQQQTRQKPPCRQLRPTRVKVTPKKWNTIKPDVVAGV